MLLRVDSFGSVPQHWIFLNICTGRQNFCLPSFFLVLATWIQGRMCGERCLGKCLYWCATLSCYSFLMLSSFHPVAHSFFSRWAPPWNPDLQSDFILSPHQSHGRGEQSLLHLCHPHPPSFLFFSSPPHLCIAASRSLAKALMLQKELQKKFLLSFFPPSFLPSPIHPLVIFSLFLCLQMELYLMDYLYHPLPLSVCLSF